MKYRTFIIDCEHAFDNCYTTRVIQVKKWYGWVTIYTTCGTWDDTTKKVNYIIKLLQND